MCDDIGLSTPLVCTFSDFLGSCIILFNYMADINSYVGHGLYVMIMSLILLLLYTGSYPAST